MFQRLAASAGDKQAVVHCNTDDATAAPVRTRSFAQLLRDVQRTKEKLLAGEDGAAAVKDLDSRRVAMLIENSYEYVGALLLCSFFENLLLSFHDWQWHWLWALGTGISES